MFVNISTCISKKIYLHFTVKLRHIIHDWPDAEALAILRNVRKSMAPHSRVLLRTCWITSILVLALISVVQMTSLSEIQTEVLMLLQKT